MRSGWTVHGSLVNTVSAGEREGERERDEVTRSVLHALLSLYTRRSQMITPGISARTEAAERAAPRSLIPLIQPALHAKWRISLDNVVT